MDPYEFKWGFDAKKKRVHHWPSSEHARRTHRDDFASLIGRKVRVQDGDVMGHGTYLPEEHTDDGNVAAPPTVLLRATFGAQIPTDVLHHFENVFPATEVRRGHKHEHPPTHHEAKVPEGFIYDPEEHNCFGHAEQVEVLNSDLRYTEGWARPIGGEWGHHAWNVAPDGSIVDAYFNARFPGEQFEYRVSPDGVDDMTPLAPHEAKWVAPMTGAEWAQANFAVKGRVRSVTSAPDEFSFSPAEWYHIEHLAAADLEGAMVAVFLPEAVGKKILVEGGEPLDLLHITLAYFKDKAADRDDWDKAKAVVERVAEKHGTLDGKIGGYGVFKNGEGDVLWASPDVPGLAELRHELVEELELEGFDVSDEHGWTPHITLKYKWDGEFPDMAEPITVSFDSLTFAQGEKKTEKRMAKTSGTAHWNCPECGMPVSLVNGWKCPNCGHDANKAAEEEAEARSNDPMVKAMHAHIDELGSDWEGIDGLEDGVNSWIELWSPSQQRSIIVTPEGVQSDSEAWWQQREKDQPKTRKTVIWDKDIGDVGTMTDWPVLPEESDGA